MKSGMRGSLFRSGQKLAVDGVWLCCVLMLAVGCQHAVNETVDAEVKLAIEPTPPQVGQAKITITLADAAGKPLTAESLDVEGNMNHAGMTPVFSTLQQVEAGRYQGKLEFTMAGDWFLLIQGQLSDGRVVNEKIDVPGVERR